MVTAIFRQMRATLIRDFRKNSSLVSYRLIPLDGRFCNASGYCTGASRLIKSRESRTTSRDNCLIRLTEPRGLFNLPTHGGTTTKLVGREAVSVFGSNSSAASQVHCRLASGRRRRNRPGPGRPLGRAFGPQASNGNLHWPKNSIEQNDLASRDQTLIARVLARKLLRRSVLACSSVAIWEYFCEFQRSKDHCRWIFSLFGTLPASQSSIPPPRSTIMLPKEPTFFGSIQNLPA